MGLSELCIRRPVLTTLVTATFIVFGIFAYRLLSVAALPSDDTKRIDRSTNHSLGIGSSAMRNDPCSSHPSSSACPNERKPSLGCGRAGFVKPPADRCPGGSRRLGHGRRLRPRRRLRVRRGLRDGRGSGLGATRLPRSREIRLSRR